MKRPINILDISDIHLGHNETETSFIIKNIKNMFEEYFSIIKNSNYLILSGDFFHKLLPNNSLEYKESIDFLIYLASFCKKQNISLRILEGTPSHDFKQLETFSNILNKLSIDIDFKYIDKLYIEYNKELDFTLLYIPDEVNHEAEITQREILELLRKHNLEKVDHITIHGQCHYHLPIFSKASFDENFLLSITDNFIVNGHIHTFSTYGRIITVGSIDRLSHNEEEKKGMIYISYLSSGNEYLFLENKNARIYKTLKYSIVDPDTIVKDIERLKLPIDSRIRIKCDKLNGNKNIKSLLSERFKNYKFKITDNKEQKTIKESLKITFNELHITKENIVELINDRLHRLNLNESLYSSINKELKDLL